MANIRKIKFEMLVQFIRFSTYLKTMNILSFYQFIFFLIFYRPDTKGQTKSNESFGGQECIVPSLGKRISVK